MPESSTPAAPPSASAPPRRLGRRLGCGAALLLLLAAGGFVLYVWAALSFDFSEGERAGYVQKFSRKGWVCKTWEGELAMVTLPGTLAETFRFSVRDDKVAEVINASVGRRVALSYEQHKGLPTDCFGETEYFVTGAKVVEP
ncbi:MAG TPA: hypothetical protein VGS22_23415 [Thermoanaerobaculia bacterium]|nr:hypothetical protein [Thermoanaerobaculia bacterium]